MHKQRTLPLDGQAPLEALWDRFPECSRQEVVTLYARLIARLIQGEKTSNAKEEDCDQAEHG